MVSKSIQDGYLVDFVSGNMVKATPEEVDAVQVFAKQLVEDYGYEKDQISTHPQYRVKARPSDTKKEYPVDIAVFSDNNKNDDNVLIIVECKQKERKDGRSQLEDYLRFSKATFGVWFNGETRFFLRKIERNGSVLFEDIPNIPKRGQPFDCIGKFKRKDLKKTHNLKVIFNSIRGYLAANATGTNRDEIIAQQIINIVFCKIFDEKFTKPEDVVQFRAGVDESATEVKDRIIALFRSVKAKYNEVITSQDEITLDADDVKYVVGELQNFCIIESERDVIADAFETFIQGALKGAQGQFFTPRNVVKLMVEIIDPKTTELIIDPACGTGGFLVECLRYLWASLDRDAINYNWPENALIEEKTNAAIKCIKGIEKDEFLCKVAKAYMAILGDGKGGIFCEDALKKPTDWKESTQQQILLGRFNVLLANPPFGKDIKVSGREKLEQYDLAHKWKTVDGQTIKTQELKDNVVIQILFVERCLKLLKNGGRMGIILPETYFHAPKSSYVLQYMTNGNNVQWVIDLPHNTFRPYNNAKCVIIILQKGVAQQDFINMAVAEQIGHDHNGKLIYRWDWKNNSIDHEHIWDDIPLILDEIRSEPSKYYFKERSGHVIDKKIFVPRYYWNNSLSQIRECADVQELELFPLRTLLDEDIITYFDGHGSPPSEYKSKGDIPYIRVKDIVNWEIYKDPTAMIPKNMYEQIKGTGKEILPLDIAYVRRGSYRIGSVALVSPFDTEALYTREILIIRFLNQENKYHITPFYLLYLLSHNLTWRQYANKILIETTLPNIGDRWQELMLPIEKNILRRDEISEKVKKAITEKWNAVTHINQLRKELGGLIT